MKPFNTNSAFLLFHMHWENLSGSYAPKTLVSFPSQEWLFTGYRRKLINSHPAFLPLILAVSCRVPSALGKVHSLTS